MPFRMQLSFNLNGFSPGPDIWQHSQSPLECAPTRQRVRQREGESERELEGVFVGEGCPAHDSRLATATLAAAEDWLCLLIFCQITQINTQLHTQVSPREGKGKRERGNGDAAQVCLVRTVTLCLGPVAAGRYPCLKDFHLFKCVLSKMDKRATLLWNLFQHSGAKVLKKCKEENQFVVPIIFFIYIISIF